MDKIVDLKKKQHEELIEHREDIGLTDEMTYVTPDQEQVGWHGPLTRHHMDPQTGMVAGIVLIVIGVLFQVFQQNWVTTIFFILAGFVVISRSRKPREIGSIEINPVGVTIGTVHYRYKDLDSFWIDYEPEISLKELSFHVKRWYMPYVKVPLFDEDPVQIRSILIKFIPEKEHPHTIIDILSRLVGL